MTAPIKKPRILTSSKTLLASSTGFRGYSIKENKLRDKANNLANEVIKCFNKNTNL